MKHTFHQRPFSISGSCTIVEKHTFIAGIPCQTVTKAFLHEPCFLRIPTHHLCDKSDRAWILCIRIIGRPCNLGQLVLWCMRMELSRLQIQCSVLAVQVINIAVKLRHCNRIHTLGITDIRVTVIPALPFRRIFQIVLSYTFISNCQGISDQTVRKGFCKLHCFQSANVRNPPGSVIHIPLFPFRHIPCDIFIHIRKQSA